MKKYLFGTIALFLIIAGCCKKKDDTPICITDKSADLKNWAKYGSYCSGGVDTQAIFYSKADFYQNGSCFITSSVPFPLDFNGIILAQSVSVPYGQSINGTQSYEKSTTIFVNSCTKTVDFKFILKNIDTTRPVYPYADTWAVAVAVDSIPHDYTVNFSHEIIPYGQ